MYLVQIQARMRRAPWPGMLQRDGLDGWRGAPTDIDDFFGLGTFASWTKLFGRDLRACAN
jgi:hypothetical protein